MIMQLRKRYILGIIYSLLWTTFYAQYVGGNKDGYSMASFSNSTTIYVGGEKDGYDGSATYVNTISIYRGGNKDGYARSDFNSSTNIYVGGRQDGYNVSAFNNSINIFSGGSRDGYSSLVLRKNFIWIGAIGEGWNVSGNWNDGITPNIHSNVIIPDGVPHFPKINAGVMNVGINLNGGTYLCKSITIHDNAELTFRVNAFLENSGSIVIHGTVYGLNSDPLAIQNLPGGNISITSTGSMVIKE